MTFKRPFQTIFGSFVAQKENVVLPKTKAEVNLLVRNVVEREIERERVQMKPHIETVF